MYFPIRALIRRLHSVPEVILSSDRFLANALDRNVKTTRNPTATFEPNSCSQMSSLATKVQPIATENFNFQHNKLYMRLWARLANEPAYEERIRERVSVIQGFIGDGFPLLLPEAISVLCGSSDMDVWISKLDGSKGLTSSTNDILVSQDRLRQVGRDFFDLQCSVLAIFTDEYYLSSSSVEIEQALLIFSERDKLVAKFMGRHSLSVCLVPFRRRRKSKQRVLRLSTMTEDRNRNAVSSFYTLLGLLVVKFGSQKVVENLWKDKIFDSPTGILKLATERNK